LISKKNLKNRKGVSWRVVAVILLAIGIVVSAAVAIYMNSIPSTEKPKPKYLPLEKISDITSAVYRVVDEDYGIVLYVVDTYTLKTAPSISGVRVGEVKVTIQDGAIQLTENPAIYRLVDSKMNTVSYVVDTYGLTSAPSIVSFPLK